MDSDYIEPHDREVIEELEDLIEDSLELVPFNWDVFTACRSENPIITKKGKKFNVYE